MAILLALPLGTVGVVGAPVTTGAPLWKRVIGATALAWMLNESSLIIHEDGSAQAAVVSNSSSQTTTSKLLSAASTAVACYEKPVVANHSCYDVQMLDQGFLSRNKGLAMVCYTRIEENGTPKKDTLRMIADNESLLTQDQETEATSPNVSSDPDKHTIDSISATTLLLDRLAQRHTADKSSLIHNYISLYGRVFNNHNRINKPMRLLEFGIGGRYISKFMGDTYEPGASLRMWAEFLEHSESVIVGVDLDEESMKGEWRWSRTGLTDDERAGIDGKIRTIQASSQSEEGRATIVEQMQMDQQIGETNNSNNIQFDVIIDDAMHSRDGQLKTLKAMWPLLRSGGLFFIEEVMGWDDGLDKIRMHRDVRFGQVGTPGASQEEHRERVMEFVAEVRGMDGFEDCLFEEYVDFTEECMHCHANSAIVVLSKGDGAAVVH